MRRITLLLGILAASTLGCGGDNATGPTPPGQSMYDGLWTADLDTSYPIQSLTFDISGGALAHVTIEGFWDLPLCDLRWSGRFDAIPPRPVVNDSVTVQGLVSGPVTIDSFAVTFTSPTTSKGAITVTLDQGGPCVATMSQSFTADRS
ncbi:MAG: hypothetical protein U0166_03105 [Acidobacteriota bacterium]